MLTIENLPLLAECDIVVVGGGPSGIAAALSAARNGGRVLLLEQGGSLGGMATSGLVPMFAPTSDGKIMLYGGVYDEISLEMCRRMNTPRDPATWQAIDPEILKRLLDELVCSASIKVYFQTKLCHAEIENGRINAIWCATSCGLKKVTGRIFIDGTGDALLAMLAGAEFECGDDEGRTMSPTLCAQFAGIDSDKRRQAIFSGMSDYDIWNHLLKEGKAPLEEHHFVCMKDISSGITTSNLGHIYGISCTNEDGLTRGYVEGRKIVHIFEEFYRKNVPGFENAKLVNTASLLGVRETRRIVGEYCLTLSDYEHRADFPDEIGRCCYPIDIHSSSTSLDEQKQVLVVLEKSALANGESYGIPYRVLIPKGIRNLLVPGRSISADRNIQSSLRVMPSCFVTGQAAGIAALLAENGETRMVDVFKLQKKLQNIGAVFH